MTRAVLVPSALLLLPEYAGLLDPVPELRRACHDAVATLVAGAPPAVAVATSPARRDNAARGVSGSPGLRIARHLLAGVGWAGPTVDPAPGVPLLVVGNGSACRSERAPGHLDARAAGFDRALGAALAGRDGEALAALDPASAEELWCHDVAAFERLAAVLTPGPAADVAYDADPFGVQYWVMTWT